MNWGLSFFFSSPPIFLRAGERREEKEGLKWWGEGWGRGCKDKTESCSQWGAPKRERQKENKQFMSRAHAACVCMPRAAGPPCSQGGFCSPAMMDGRIGPFRPAMLQQRYLHNTGLPPVTSDTGQPGLGPPPTPASPGPSDTARTQPMSSLTLGLGGPHCCRDAPSTDTLPRVLPAPLS